MWTYLRYQQSLSAVPTNSRRCEKGGEGDGRKKPHQRRDARVVSPPLGSCESCRMIFERLGKHLTVDGTKSASRKIRFFSLSPVRQLSVRTSRSKGSCPRSGLSAPSAASGALLNRGSAVLPSSSDTTEWEESCRSTARIRRYISLLLHIAEREWERLGKGCITCP
jgi:hypothetical protein